MYHYTYRLDLIETGEYYFGSRTSEVDPTLDNYFGSMRSWRPDKKKLIKTILKYDFKNRKDCILHERELIIKYRKDPLNKNAHIPPINYNTSGLGQYVDENGKTYKVFKNDELVLNGTLVGFHKGKKHTDKAKKKMSKSAKNRKIIKENEEIRKRKISDSLREKKKPPVFGENMSKNRKGKNNPYSKFLKKTGTPHHASKKVNQYTITGKLIKTWINCSIAADKLKLNYKSINACVRGKNKTSGGYIWKYVN